MDNLITLKRNIFIAGFIALVLILAIFLPFLSKKVERAKIKKLDAIVTGLKYAPTDKRGEAFSNLVSSGKTFELSTSSASEGRYCVFLSVSLRQTEPLIADFPETVQLVRDLRQLKLDQKCGD